ncbi:MAG: hypothetical protein ACLUGJ_01190 [Blautia wexlerae]
MISTEVTLRRYNTEDEAKKYTVEATLLMLIRMKYSLSPWAMWFSMKMKQNFSFL